MATPTYQGVGQPVVDNGGFLSGLASWFGGSTPAYAGKGQPAASSGFGGGTPAYKSAPAPSSTDAIAQSIDPDSVAIVIPRGLIEQS